MVGRTITPTRAKYLKEQLTKYGRCAPLSLQYTIDMNVNGNHYILMVQFWKKQIFVLQAVRWWADENEPGGRKYRLYIQSKILSALLILLIHQFHPMDERHNEDMDLSQLVIDLEQVEDDKSEPAE